MDVVYVGMYACVDALMLMLFVGFEVDVCDA